MRIRNSLLALALVGVAPHDLAAQASDADLRRTVADYVGLYRRETLDRWRALFLPGFTAAYTTAEGGVRERTLDEFFAAQRRYLATGRAIREELENVRVERSGRIASVWADFVLTDEGERSRGRLVLLLADDGGAWKIHSLMFSYDR